MPRFFVIGFNHHQSNASLRSVYTLRAEQKEKLLAEASGAGISSLIILNTCNRTELYGYGRIQDAERLFFDVLGVRKSPAHKMITRQGREAILHMFRVAAGLDSQIVGDLEILGQFKRAFATAKEHQTVDGLFERLVNNCLRAAKEVRSRTRICAGTVSLSYAAMQYVKDYYNGRHCHVVILGAGKFGARIAANMHDYFPAARLSVCNRTKQKALELAAQFGASVIDFEDVAKLNEADVIISSVDDTGKFVLNTNNVRHSDKERLFIDMSIPLSIDPLIGQQPLNKLISLDEIGKVISETLETRKEDLPLADKIIEAHLDEWHAWLMQRDKSDSIREWKQRIQQLSMTCPALSQLSAVDKENMIRKSVAGFAAYIRQQPQLSGSAEDIISHFLTDEKSCAGLNPVVLQSSFFAPGQGHQPGANRLAGCN